MLYILKDKLTGELNHVYGVNRYEDKTTFLVYTEDYGWSWIDSSYVEPLITKSLDMLRDE